MTSGPDYRNALAVPPDALGRGSPVAFEVVRDDGEHLCIPDDLGYPVTSEPVLTALRG